MMMFPRCITVALNQDQSKSHPERMSNIKPFINQYHWKEINFSSNKKDWNDFKKNNKAIAFNILYVPHNTEKIKHAYQS